MLARVRSATPWGIDARPVRVEVDVRRGLPGLQIVGLPDAAVRESRERVRSAIANCGIELKHRAAVINLAPADIRKEGNHLDAPIATGLLAAHGMLPEKSPEGRLVCGELGLDGAARPIRGALAIAELAGRLGAREVLLPRPNAAEAAALGVVPVAGFSGLGELIEHLAGTRELPRAIGRSYRPEGAGDQPDLAEVRGQEAAKRALEIAAAGGHNLLLIGPPGSGKTMLARRLPALLPPLTQAEAIEVTRIWSLAADEPPEGLVGRRPFRSPHTGISAPGMVGGGSVPRPGEASLAHCGVLFLDELPEFRRDVLEGLRQPLEDSQIWIVRARARLRFPARFALLAAMNPCRCGHLGDPRHECGCSAAEVERYRRRVSGPLLDRIDLHVEVPAVELDELKADPGEPTTEVAGRVLAARDRQRRRFGGQAAHSTNAALDGEALRRHCRLDAGAQTLLDRAFDRLGLSARAVTRILKVARTIADLASRDRLTSADVAEAIQYRTLDRRISR